ncbi:putative long chain acyl-CoA synthetase 9, chloroplastic-like [Capsicum annuum]|nr:putative long chain acyl-CoA synthetase 9, chloroplastic-like [Capsicum annuum]
MKKDIVKFVAKCSVCQQVKVEYQWPIGTLQESSIPTWKWEKVNMDFLIGLPRSHHQHDSIWVIVNSSTHERGEEVWKNGKLSVRYVGPSRILSRVGKVADKLELPAYLPSVHHVFHVSLLKKCSSDPAVVVPLESTDICDSFSYEEIPVEILDLHIHKLRNKEVPLRCGKYHGEEATTLRWRPNWRLSVSSSSSRLNRITVSIVMSMPSHHDEARIDNFHNPLSHCDSTASRWLQMGSLSLGYTPWQEYDTSPQCEVFPLGELNVGYYDSSHSVQVLSFSSVSDFEHLYLHPDSWSFRFSEGLQATIHAVVRVTSGKNISAKERKTGRVPSIVFEQEDGQHGGNKRLVCVQANQIRKLVNHLGRSHFLSRAEKYFNELSKFLSSKLSKVDFDKSCIRTIGRENIHLHNRLLLSKPLHSGSVYNFSLETCQSCGELPESRFLRSHLEWKLQSEGLGISSDCANLLNNSLDAF